MINLKQTPCIKQSFNGSQQVNTRCFRVSLPFTMFEKSLTDLIRGIRANKKNEQKYIAVCLQEIRNEVKSNDLDIKATAVAKLTYVSCIMFSCFAVFLRYIN